MAGPHKPYPKMMYHATEQPKVVMNEAEMMEALKKGYSITRVDFNEAHALKNRKAKLMDEVRIIDMRLAAIESLSDGPIPPKTDDAPPPSPVPSKKIYVPKKKKGTKEE